LQGFIRDLISVFSLVAHLIFDHNDLSDALAYR